MKRAFAALGLIVALSACEGGGDPVQQALRDSAAANHAAAVKEGEVSTADHTAMGAGTAPGGQALAASEAPMHAGMAAAAGPSVDEAYIARMIEHHRAAVAMAEVALAESQDPDIRRMAQAVKDAQTREIAEMRAWEAAPAN